MFNKFIGSVKGQLNKWNNLVLGDKLIIIGYIILMFTIFQIDKRIYGLIQGISLMGAGYLLINN